MNPLPTYGGQAVIEGVMMRGGNAVAIAMRAPDQTIVVHTEALSGIYKSKLVKIPFLRGLVVLWDALGLGMRALTISANLQSGDDEKLEGPKLYLTLAFSLAFGIGLFFLLPAGISWIVEKYILNSAFLHYAPTGFFSFIGGSHHWISSILEGLLRLVILIVYIVLIGRVDEIKRLFGYHGAEHKTINAYESGVELIPENVAKFPLEHPRCGTAFLLTLILASILIFTVLGPLPIYLRLLSRIILIPVLAALAYEYIRWTANHINSPFIQFLIKPNLALQSLTTREPTMEMIEVAIASFRAMRKQEDSKSHLISS